MAISQHGRSIAQNRFNRILKYIEPAEEVPNIFARYLESENQANLGDCYWIITTSIKQYIELFFQLQQVEIVLQNALHSQKGEIAVKLREHMRMRITNFCAFLRFKKHIAITYSLWERAHQKTPDQHSNHLTRQLIDFQLVSIKNLKDCPLRTALSKALMRLTSQFNSGNLITPICFMDSIEDVFEEQGLIKLLASCNVHGHARAWMKHPTVESVGIQNPVDKSDKAWIIKGYKPWEHYRSVNLPLFESQVDGMFADCLMTGSSAIASQPLNDSSAKRFNELPSYELRDQPLSQVVPKMYDPSNVFDDASYDENRNPQVQQSGAQIPKDIKVILHQSTSPLLYHPCECKPPSTMFPMTQVSPVMEWRSPPVPSDRCHKIQAKIDKGSKVRRTLIQTMPESVSPARCKNQHIAASRTLAVRNKAKYDPIGAEDKQQEVEKRRSQLSKDYKIHQLRELVIPIPREPEEGVSDLGDM